MASNGYARITAGVKLVDINPEKNNNFSLYNDGWGEGMFPLPYSTTSSSNKMGTTLVLNGYKKVAFCVAGGVTFNSFKMNFVYRDGTKSSEISLPTSKSQGWTNYMDIPDNTKYMEFTARGTGDLTIIAFSALA